MSFHFNFHADWFILKFTISTVDCSTDRHQPKLLSTKARHPSNVFLKFSSPVGRLPTIYQSYHPTAVRLRPHRNQSRHQPKLLSTKARHPSNVFLKFSSPVGRLPTIYQSDHPTAVRLRQHRNQSRHIIWPQSTESTEVWTKILI